MAAPTVVTSGTYGGTTALSHSTSYPATQAGDYLVLLVGVDKGSATATTITGPSGWSAATVQGTAGSTAYNIGRAYYLLCDGTETGTFSTSYSTSSLAGGVWALIRGADAFANWLIDFTTYQAGNDNKLDPLVSNGVTATSAEAVLLGLVTWDESKTLSAAPSGFTSLGHVDVSGLDVRGDYKTLSASGATGSITWDISSATRYNAVTIWIPAGSSGQTISGALYSNSQTFYGATVAPGAVSIDGALFTNGQTFYAAAVSASYGIAAERFDNGQTFYQATVAPGAVSIDGDLFSNAQVFFGATVTQSSGEQAISASLLENGQTFYGATVVSLEAPATRRGSSITPRNAERADRDAQLFEQAQRESAEALRAIIERAFDGDPPPLPPAVVRQVVAEFGPITKDPGPAVMRRIAQAIAKAQQDRDDDEAAAMLLLVA